MANTYTLLAAEPVTLLATILAALTLAGFMALVGNRLTQALVTPLFEHFKLPTFWLLYVAWAVSSLCVLAAGADFMGLTLQVLTQAAGLPYTTSPVVSMLLSCIIAGGGSNFMHELFSYLGQGGNGVGLAIQVNTSPEQSGEMHVGTITS